MRRARIAPVLLALLAVPALVVPAKAIAGPPEGVSGKMVFDEVADGLRKCLREKDKCKRVEMLGQLAETRDPRVAVALAELAWKQAGFWVTCGNSNHTHNAAMLLMQNYFPEEPSLGQERERCWDEKGGDLRRRAKQLPQ